MPNRTSRIQVDFRIVFQSSFHCGTGLRAGVVHRTVVRNNDGFLIIPGSTLKGLIRENCERIAGTLGLRTSDPHDEAGALAGYGRCPDIISRIFGSRNLPGTVFFDDASLTPDWKDLFEARGVPSFRQEFQARQVYPRSTVAISRVTGTARPGFLVTSEYAGWPGVTFVGQIHGFVDGWSLEDDSETNCESALLLVGLLLVDRIGAQRSSGCGRCVVEVDRVTMGDGSIEPEACLKGLDELLLYEEGREVGI